MNQLSFSNIEYSLRKRTTRREEFLKKMDEIIPWDEWVAYIEPYYPKGKRGRLPSTYGDREDVADVSFAKLVQFIG